MTATASTPPSASSSGRDPSGAPGPARRLIPVLAGIGSLVFAVAAGVWWLVPSTNTFADPESMLAPDQTLLGAVLTARASAQLLFGLSVLGVVVSAMAVAARRRSIPGLNAVVGGFGIVFALIVGFGLLSVSAISIAGYLMALIVPVGAVALAVQLVRTSRVGRWIVAGAVGALVAVFTTGVLPASALPDLGGRIVDLAGEVPVIALVLGLTATVLLWALVGGQALRTAHVLDAAGRWVLRHRRGITIVAALGPLPYALIRLTWLTPWPQLALDEALPPDVRIWGLMLSSGAWAGTILTIGLIRPWGEVFPRWMPVVAGRPVPVWVAAGPGSVVAAVLIVSAAPMIRMFAEEGTTDALVSALVFPMWIWGPALALAVWGYVLHRRQTVDRPVPQPPLPHA